MPNTSVIRSILKRKAHSETLPSSSSTSILNSSEPIPTPAPKVDHHIFLTAERKNKQRKYPKDIVGYGPGGEIIYRRSRPQYGQVQIVVPAGAPAPEQPPAPDSNYYSLPSTDFTFEVPLNNLPFDLNDVPDNLMNRGDKRSVHAKRKHAQASRWDMQVLPSLICPFINFKRRQVDDSSGARNSHASTTCTCLAASHELVVTCVQQETMEDIKLVVCSCQPAVLQLIQRGMFPCSPVNPRMAFSIIMLDFVSELFVRMAPNQRAWAATLMHHLEEKGYVFTTADSLRRRFGDTLARYQSLVRLVNAEVAEVIEKARGLVQPSSNTALPSPDVVLDPPNLAIDEKTPISQRLYTNSLASSLPPVATSAPRIPGPVSSSNSPSSLSKTGDRPSAYLRSRCPLCFGGNFTCVSDERIQAMVCIDANFQLKRNADKDRRKSHKGEKGERDPSVTSPCTIFIPQSTCDQWEKRFDDIRGMTKSKPKQSDYASSAHPGHHNNDCDCDDHDHLEPGMSIPKSVLDQCEGSFVAADGDRIKASTQYFDDTGVMAMLCRHDHPLFLTNLRTAGEKQFYALALLSTLMDHLPSNWRIGLLYDIACQLHRSLNKWPELSTWVPRMEFAVSVFHAYGHQWTCQLWYHPRKSELWGLSDGEGCERFWSELRKLIPNLRVTGFHWRLFVLDLQVEHIDQMKMESIGKWLQDRVTRSREHLAEAQAGLGNQNLDYLLSQFQGQRAYQSKPLSRQSKTQGAKAVDSILALSDTSASLWELVTLMQQELSSLMKDNLEGTTNHRMQLAEKIRNQIESVRRIDRNIDAKTKALGASDVDNLKKLKTDKWVNAQMNLRVLRDQILAKLRARRFELANLERAYRSKMLDKKTQDHAEQAIKRREPGITATVKRYNTRLQELRDLKKAGSAPPHAVIPIDLKTDGLYKLDVDSGIFNDLLNVDLSEFPGGKPPAWLADNEVKIGIRLAQKARSCERELRRCEMERLNLQVWFREEYAVLTVAIRFCTDEDLVFCLQSHQQGLLRLLRLWQAAMKDVPVNSGLHDWIPDTAPPPTVPSKAVPARATRSRGFVLRDYDVDSSDDDDQDGLDDDEIGADFSIIATLDRNLVIEETADNVPTSSIPHG